MFKIKFWSLALLILLPGVGLTFTVTEPLRSSAHQRALDHLVASASLVESHLLQESNKLVEMATSAATLPDVRAALVEGSRGQEKLDKRLAAALADVRVGSGRFFLVLTKDGHGAYRTDHPERVNDSFAGLPLVQEGLAGVRRDGVWLLGDIFHRVAIVPVRDRGVVVGAVLVADPVTQEDAEAMAHATKLPLTILVGDKVLGASLGEVDTRLTASPAAFGKAEVGMAPFPLLVGEPAQWLGKAVSVVDAWPNLRVAVAVPYAPVFEMVALVQFWIALLTLAAFLLVFGWSFIIYRSISTPLSRITDHLSAITQGTASGILPETGLGPYLRLAKLVNMVLDKVPGGLGRSPVSLGSGNSGEFNLSRNRSISSPGGIPAANTPLAPPAASLGLGSVPPPENKGSGSVMDELFGPTPTSTPPIPKPASPGASMMEDLFGKPTAPSLPKPSSEAKPGSSSVMDELFGPTPSSPPVKPPPPPPPPFMAAASASDADGFGPSAAERTVLSQAPADLLAASASPVMPPRHPTPPPPQPPVASMPPVSLPPISMPPPAAPRMPQPPPPPPPIGAAQTTAEATVMVAIPAELLARSSAASMPPQDEEEAHFRDVYQQFLKTREQCGEPADDLTYERFVGKLLKNKQQLLEKYKCRTVRFQVYVKQGKAALKAVPVRD